MAGSVPFVTVAADPLVDPPKGWIARIVGQALALALVALAAVLALFPTNTQIHQGARGDAATVRCGSPVLVLTGHAAATSGPQAKDARADCAAKARARAHAAEVIGPAGAAGWVVLTAVGRRASRRPQAAENS